MDINNRNQGATFWRGSGKERVGGGKYLHEIDVLIQKQLCLINGQVREKGTRK
jgi:hypothetical protein